MENNDYKTIISDATRSLKEKLNWDQISEKPTTAIVLGSGLGEFVHSLKNTVKIPYTDIAHMHGSSVAGHSGNWVYGLTENNTPVLVAQGRYHFYEGHGFKTVTLPVRMMKELGIKNLILTNAAGSVNTDYKPGDFMLITDHINMTGHSPLRGINTDEFGPRFVDLSEAYNLELAEKLFDHCKKNNPDLTLHKGVYVCAIGPMYETPTEIKMYRTLGADAVGMSTAVSYTHLRAHET